VYIDNNVIIICSYILSQFSLVYFLRPCSFEFHFDIIFKSKLRSPNRFHFFVFLDYIFVSIYPSPNCAIYFILLDLTSGIIFGERLNYEALLHKIFCAQIYIAINSSQIQFWFVTVVCTCLNAFSTNLLSIFIRYFVFHSCVETLMYIGFLCIQFQTSLFTST
jgi:hypothetical protein